MVNLSLDSVIVKFLSSFRLCSGASKPGIKGLVQRTYDGIPLLPGSTLKGVYRELAERLCLSIMGVNSCKAPQELCKTSFCPVCKLFGNPRLPGRIFFSDGLPIEANKPEIRDSLSLLSELRTQIGIDRYTKTTFQGMLVVNETLPSEMEFSFSVEGKLEGEAEWNFIKILIPSLNKIGAGTSRGTGHCQVNYAKGQFANRAWEYRHSAGKWEAVQ